MFFKEQRSSFNPVHPLTCPLKDVLCVSDVAKQLLVFGELNIPWFGSRTRTRLGRTTLLLLLFSFIWLFIQPTNITRSFSLGLLTLISLLSFSLALYSANQYGLYRDTSAISICLQPSQLSA